MFTKTSKLAKKMIYNQNKEGKCCPIFFQNPLGTTIIKKLPFVPI